VDDLIQTLKDEYDGVPTLIMDLLEPDEKLGRHGFDIRTILCPDGSIQMYHSNFLGSCEEYFVWSANWNCTIDFVNEKCLSCQWYDGNSNKKYYKENPWLRD